MKNRYCIGSKLPETTFRALVRAYFMGKTTEDAARALKVSQGSVKNLYRRLTYRLIDDFQIFEFYRDLLSDCFETGGRRIESLKRCLWQCPGDSGYESLPDRDLCTECPFASEFREVIAEDHAARTMYFERRALAPLTSFNFVSRAAYIFAQRRFFYGPDKERRAQAGQFIAMLKEHPLGSRGGKKQIADRYVNLSGTRPLWYVASLDQEYHLPNHEMM
ncbi:hypothetical protein ATO8_15197 [Roseivivax marinus]|uniref:RNA polymerase sigma factor 70 region 4 type 2 domain-containing protein n=1 Tax=Roseivivax marinus TaxID=1379903 RepID=W4HH45_9RHOB|nr:sigma-70 region 4 domain-containing protein [Roseivivax marinus]ETW12024.1 hypothetical protein ATO8_15197 [Roseivivax marinus]